MQFSFTHIKNLHKVTVSLNISGLNMYAYFLS